MHIEINHPEKRKFSSKKTNKSQFTSRWYWKQWRQQEKELPKPGRPA